MKFYIGASLKNSNLVNYYAKKLIKNNWIHTYNWVENIDKDITINNLKEYAIKEQNAINDFDVVIILLPAGRGTHIELGLALSLNKKVFLCGNKDEFNLENTVAFYNLPNIVRLTGTDDDNIEEILKWK